VPFFLAGLPKLIRSTSWMVGRQHFCRVWYVIFSGPGFVEKSFVDVNVDVRGSDALGDKRLCIDIDGWVNVRVDLVVTRVVWNAATEGARMAVVVRILDGWHSNVRKKDAMKTFMLRFTLSIYFDRVRVGGAGNAIKVN
jgi:hypothetical protein